MKYESPKMDIIELRPVDIIQVSIEPGTGGGGGENELPGLPLSLDQKY